MEPNEASDLAILIALPSAALSPLARERADDLALIAHAADDIILRERDRVSGQLPQLNDTLQR